MPNITNVVLVTGAQERADITITVAMAKGVPGALILAQFTPKCGRTVTLLCQWIASPTVLAETG